MELVKARFKLAEADYQRRVATQEKSDAKK